MRTVSFDESPDLFSLLSVNTVTPKTKRFFKSLVKDSYEFFSKYLVFLPQIDQDIARFYYIDGLSQDQISTLYNISQAAISRRLKYIIERIKFLVKAPSLDPIQIREDLQFLFPPELFEFAYLFYWELAQNRVKFFIKTSQSGAANKLTKVLNFLEDLSSEEPISDTDMVDPDHERRKYLALIYVDYFRFIYKKSNIITFLCKRNDAERSNSFIKGIPIVTIEQV